MKNITQTNEHCLRMHSSAYVEKVNFPDESEFRNIRDSGSIEAITLILALIGFGLALYQAKLSRESLNAATVAIQDDRRTRQIAALPQMDWVIQVQVKLEIWRKQIEKAKRSIVSASAEQDADALRHIADKAPKSPSQVGVSRREYEEIPDYLRQILMSGAQYYYDAAAPVNSVWSTTKNQPNWEYAQEIIDRLDESINALQELHALIKDMLPGVISETPASLNDQDFVKE